jgi:hypothetical protein
MDELGWIFILCIIGFILLMVFADPIKHSEKKLHQYLQNKGLREYEILRPANKEEIPTKLRNSPNYYGCIPFKGFAMALRDSMYRKIELTNADMQKKTIWVRIDTLFYYINRFHFNKDFDKLT